MFGIEPDVDGVLYEFFTRNDEGTLCLEAELFIPFDHSVPPADEHVGCVVDDTFFLLYNHVSPDADEAG